MKKPLVYLSSPLTQGNREKNLKAHFNMFFDLVREGVVTPIAPLANEAIEEREPQSYEFWLRYDFDIIRHCDAVFAFDAAFGDGYYQHVSRGRDLEVAFAKQIGVPVFFNLESLYKYFSDSIKAHEKSEQSSDVFFTAIRFATI